MFSNPSYVIDFFGLLDDDHPVDDKLRHHQSDDNEEKNLLQQEDTVDNNSNGSWWLEAIWVVEDMENKQTKTELSTMVSTFNLAFSHTIYIIMTIRLPH